MTPSYRKALLAVGLATGLSVCTYAAGLPASRLSLEEIEVVAQKTALRSDAYRLVAVIPQEEIASLPVQTVAEILQYVPGLDVRRRGAHDAQADISMRGGTFDQVLVLINGIPLSDAQTGHYTLNLPLSSLLISRIEVLQGADAVSAGTNAFAGAVNIVTASRDDAASSGSVRTRLRLQTGMNSLLRPSAAITACSGEVEVNASAEYARNDGYYAPAPSAREREGLTNNDCRSANIYVQTRWRGLDVQAGAQYKDAGAGLFYGGSTDQFDATRTGFVSARYDHRRGAWGLHAQAVYRANHDHYEWHRGQTPGSNTHLTQTASAALRGSYVSPIGTTSVGVDLRSEHIRSTNLGDTSRLHLTYFASQTVNHRRLNASLNVSGNYSTFFGHHISGGANIGYEYLPGSNVYLHAHRALRMPTFTDLYYDAGNQLGSRDLQPEKAWTLSLGGTYNRHALHLSADGWYRFGTDIIDWVYVPEDTRRPYHAMNRQRVHAAGMELTAVWRPADMKQGTSDNAHSALNDWLRMAKLSYAYTWQDIDLHETQSRYLDYLSHKLVLGLEHGIWLSGNPGQKGIIAASWTLRWQKREGDYTSAEGVVTGYSPVLLLDGSIYWQNAQAKVSAECTNITNRHYYDYGSMLMPGAWATLSIEVTL